MPAPAKKPATTPIPVQLSETEFNEFILPHLSMPKRGPQCKLGYHRVFNLILWVLYTGMQWQCLPVSTDRDGNPEIHYTTVYKVFAKWSDDESLEHAFIASVGHLSDQKQLDLRILHGDGTNTVAKKGGDGIGYSGHKHEKGEKVIAIIDNNGYVLSPLPVTPVNKADTALLPEGLNALKRVTKLTGLVLKGSYFNLDGGFDSKHNRKVIFNAGMIPTIPENPRNRKTTKRGRKRLFNTLKNQGYHFEHNFGHGYQHLSVVFAILMMLAFLVDQVQQMCCPLFQAVWAKLGANVGFGRRCDPCSMMMLWSQCSNCSKRCFTA